MRLSLLSLFSLLFLANSSLGLAQEPSVTLREFSKTHRLVLVRGVLNELPGAGVKPLVEALGNALPDLRIEVLSPSSGTPIEQNAFAIVSKLTTWNQADPSRKMLLLGHSKGGVESALAALEWACFAPSLRNQLAGVVTVESPLEGWIIADRTRGLPGTRAGTRSLESGRLSEAQNDFWQSRFLALSLDSQTWLDRRTFFVRSALASSAMAPGLRILGRYLESGRDGGPNDGVVLLKSQSLRSFGQILETRADDHSLIEGPPFQSLTEEEIQRQKDFALELLEKVVSAVESSG